MKDKAINALAVKAKKGNSKSSCELIRILEPYIDRTIRRLGVYPDSKKVKILEYADLLSEAQLILLTRVLSGYDSRKGSFMHYAIRFLSKEIFKKLYRAVEKIRLEIPFSTLAETLSSDGDERLLETLKPFQINDNSLKDVELLIELKGICQGLTSDERKIIKDLFAEGKFSPVRHKVKEMKLSASTIWRIRKNLKSKILKNF